MTQVFADGERLGEAGLRALSVDATTSMRRMVRQRGPAADELRDTLGPALTAGKGVRPVRCVGCSEATLPRSDDNAPLCTRCSELLAESVQRPAASIASLWRRRRMPGV